MSHAQRLVQAGALAEARRLVRRSLAAEPSSVPGLTLAGQIAIRDAALQDAVRLFGRAAWVHRQQDPRALLNLARAQEMAGRSGDALATAGRAAALFPDDPRPRGLTALLHITAGRPDAAVAALHPADSRRLDPDTAYKIGKALAEDPLHARSATALLARAASAPGRFQSSAAGDLETALRTVAGSAKPTDPTGYTAACRLLVLSPASVEGMDAVERALAARRHPVRQAAWLWRSCCVRTADRGRLVRAAELTHLVKWPTHGLAANFRLLALQPNQLTLITRICELFGRLRALAKDAEKERAKARAVAWGLSVLGPDQADPRIWDVVAGMFKDVEAFDEAARLWREIIARFPKFQALHYNYGLFLDERQQPHQAIRRLRMALLLSPGYLKASNLLSMVMTHVHDIDQALRYVRWAIVSNPRHPTCWVNYGTFLRAVGDYTKALDAFRMAELRAGGDKHMEASGRFNSGMSLITIGELETGFNRIEARWATRDFPSPRRPFKLPIWGGPQQNPDTRLLAFMEQGMGDEVMISWYVPLLRADTESLMVDCDERLVDLFTRTYEGVEFVPRSLRCHDRTRDPRLRHKVPMLHVPQYYVPEVKFLIRDNWDWAERRGERFPARLTLAPERLERWDRWLSERYPGRARLALSWRSKMRSRTRDQQYLSIEELATAIPSGTVAVNLQYSSTDEEIDELAALGRRRGFEVVTPEGVDLTNDLEDVLALLQVSDAAVTPMISLAWMAGAVGCPAYVFRTSRERMIWQQFGTPFVPWAPSLRLFFRDPSESWSVVVRDLRGRLEWFLGNHSGRARS